MTLLSRKADYALLILWYLHQRRGGGSAREIAERFELSKAFVANILKELCQKGFVTSHRGVKGGYHLQRPASEVTLAELLDALDETMRVATCTGHEVEGCTLSAACPVKGPIEALHGRLTEMLRNVRLSELFGPIPAGDGFISLPVISMAGLATVS